MRRNLSATALACLVISAAVAGCHKTPAEKRAELLHDLRQCMDEMGPPFVGDKLVYSPCAKLDVTALTGIARAELLAALGPPTYCQLPPIVPKEPDCPAHYNQWSFYRLPRLMVGGGPELTCEVDQAGHCSVVRWGNSL